MTEETGRYTIFKTPYGWMGVVKTQRGLHTTILPRLSLDEIKAFLKKHFVIALFRDDRGLASLKDKILKYLSGSVVKFDETLDLSEATDFEKKVWQMASTIPFGETRSYDWVSRKLGDPKARRAVGRALARNRLPLIIPCHRVISKTGTLGGYVAGVNLKRLLLKIEGRIW